MSSGETVQEALDHLLDPLDVPVPGAGMAQEDGDAASALRARGRRVDIGAFLVRLKRSRRLPYKLPRVLLGWTALIVGVSGLIWITFSLVGLR